MTNADVVVPFPSPRTDGLQSGIDSQNDKDHVVYYEKSRETVALVNETINSVLESTFQLSNDFHLDISLGRDKGAYYFSINARMYVPPSDSVFESAIAAPGSTLPEYLYRGRAKTESATCVGYRVFDLPDPLESLSVIRSRLDQSTVQLMDCVVSRPIGIGLEIRTANMNRLVSEATERAVRFDLLRFLINGISSVEVERLAFIGLHVFSGRLVSLPASYEIVDGTVKSVSMPMEELVDPSFRFLDPSRPRVTVTVVALALQLS